MLHFVFDLDDTLIIHRGQINYEWIYPDRSLCSILSRCSERGLCHLYTNGTKSHADVLLEKMDLARFFKERVYPREFHGLKPSVSSFTKVGDKICAGDTCEDNHIIFFDDMIENLKTAKDFGWTTIWISRYHGSVGHYPYINHAYGSVVDALTKIHKMLL